MTEVNANIIIVLLVINLIGLLVIGLRVSGQQGDARKLDQRLTALELRVEHLPKHSDLTALGSAINKMAETVATINGQTQTMTHMLRTVQEHLLEHDHR